MSNLSFANRAIINYSDLNNDPISKSLIDIIFDGADSLGFDDNSWLAYKAPRFVNSIGNKVHPDVLIVSAKHGIQIIKVVDNYRKLDDPDYLESNYTDLMDMYNVIYGKLFMINQLKAGIHDLKININGILYASGVNDIKEHNGMTILGNTKLVEYLNKLEFGIEEEIILLASATIDGSGGLNKSTNTRIVIDNPDTKAKKLSIIESEIAMFDRDQRVAASVIIDGPQRIRGLAGSGKTVVLAMKIAQIHLNNPDDKILFTFSTKSLYNQVKDLITRFYRQFDYKDPDWDKIHIRHGWGNRNLNGVYYDCCLRLGIDPMTVDTAKELFGSGGDLFGKLCERLYTNHDITPIYDYIVIDEGQDFSNHFYRLCWRLVKKDRIIWGYDELQNIFDMKIQDLKNTFGKLDGRELKFNESANIPSDLILYKCYRNPRELLCIALGLGLGLYHSERILQMIENKEYWEDLGFSVISGDYNEGDQMKIERSKENSPLIKEDVLGNDLLKVFTFPTIVEEMDFVANAIYNDIAIEGLKPDDIMVICLDHIYAKNYYGNLISALSKLGIQAFTYSENTPSSSDFKREGCVTLTSVHRAKGNEGGSIYIVGADQLYRFNNGNDIIERNKIFTALTRSHARATITGVGTDAMGKLDSEIARIKKDYPEYNFTMPNIEKMRKFQRDLASKQAELNSVIKELDRIRGKLGEEQFEALLKSLK